MTEVYIVRGQTGAYSDYQEWDAAAFFRRDDADALVKQLNEWCLANLAHTSQEKERARRKHLERIPVLCPLDSQFNCDGLYGTEYNLATIEVRD